MSKTLRYASAAWILGATVYGWTAGCSSSTPPNSGDDGGPGDSSPPATESGPPPADGATMTEAASGDATSTGDGASFTYTLIDDMETTTHGPIELTGIAPPESPAYWFNFGGTAPGDVLTPPYQSFVFSPVTPPTTTLMGKMSSHAAYELCTLNGQYDVCGVGFEFAQVPADDAGPDAGCVLATGAGTPDGGSDGGSTADAAPTDAGSDVATDTATPDAGDGAAVADAARLDAGNDGVVASDAAIQDGGDSGPPICQTTVPFDISQYKGITFWGKTTAGDAGSLDVKVLFPDTDTDPRGNVCNSAAAGASGPTDTTQCYNSFTKHVTFTGEWQEFTVMLADLKQETTFGYILLPGSWTGKNVYGINWQGQDNNAPDSGTVTMDMWVDDVYFIQ